jgi:hypothetical protein
MVNLRNRFPARRRFLKQSAALTASASIAAPVMALAAAQPPAAPVEAGEGESRRPAATVAARQSQRRPR